MLQTEFIEKFNGLNNMVADVRIKHLLYGNQTIRKCVLHPFVDVDRIGIKINGEDIYITMDELRDGCIDDKLCWLKSDVVTITLKMK